LFVISVAFVLILRVILSHSKSVAEKSRQVFKRYAILIFSNIFMMCLVLGKKYSLIPAVMLSLVLSIIKVVIFLDVLVFILLIVKAIIKRKRKKKKGAGNLD